MTSYLIFIKGDNLAFAIPSTSIKVIQSGLPLLRNDCLCESVLVVSHSPESTPLYIFLNPRNTKTRLLNWLRCSPNTRPNLELSADDLILVSTTNPSEE